MSATSQTKGTCDQCEMFQTIAAKLAFLVTGDEQRAAALLAGCIDSERARRWRADEPA